MRAKEFINEEINPDILNPKFKHLLEIDGLDYTATVEPDKFSPQGGLRLVIKCVDKATHAGTGKFNVHENSKGDQWLESSITWVNPNYRGQNIASNIYAYAKMLGNDIKPSSDRTPAGKDMWSAWERSGEAKHLMKEEINPDILDTRFSHKQKIGDYTYTAKTEPHIFNGKEKSPFFVISCYDGDKKVGTATFYTSFRNYLVSHLISVHPEYQKKGIASTMYAYARMLGNTVEPSGHQLPPGKKMWKAWKKSGEAKHLMKEDEPIISNPREAAKAWIEKVYAKYPTTMQNNHVMVWGEGDSQQFAMFELVPSFSKRGAVEVKWFQAYPLRAGVGSRAMKELQALAREDGISLTLFPWDKGQVSQAKLTKFYKGQGFKPVAKGSKSMAWDHAINETKHRQRTILAAVHSIAN